MTTKGKALELFDKYYEVTNNYYEAKQCALIAVDEIIEMYNEINVNGFLKPNSIGFILDEIKKEIEKL
jgi:hypothetical protein